MSARHGQDARATIVIALFAVVTCAVAQDRAAPALGSLEAAGVKTFPSVVQELGGGKFEGWTGLEIKANEAALKLPGVAKFLYPPTKDKEPANALPAANWYDTFGLRFGVQLPDDAPVEFAVGLLRDEGFGETGGATRVTIKGQGWHELSLPWAVFSFRQAFPLFLQNMHGLEISAKRVDGKPGRIVLRAPQVVRAETVWLHAPVRGKSVEPGGTAQYEVLVGNATAQPQAVSLAFENKGYDSMPATVEPQTLDLAPGEVKTATARVMVPARVPQGGHEMQRLRAVANGAASRSEALEFVTASSVSHPNIILTKDGWNEVREKVKNYDWAKQAADEIIAAADKWNPPEVANKDNPKRGDWLFRTQSEEGAKASAMAYQLTGDKKYAEKVRTFLLRLSDPNNGFPVTRRACHQASVQEGGYFQGIASDYDMTLPSGVYTDADRAQIDTTLRLYIDSEPGGGGQISNWNVSSLTGALFTSLVLQDLERAERFLGAPGAIVDQLREGTLDDGWWYELAISYNTWVASMFSQAALAMRPWGMDLANMRFPASLRPNDQRIPEKSDYGATDAKWGPIHNNWIGIKRMWDILPKMADYRGVMFGVNDSTERSVTGDRMELAYYLYRDPAYAALIKKSNGRRDLIYGVPELPENPPDPSSHSAFSDNAGVAVLRSQTAERPPREQIQAVLRYGDHGWYHGHFDRGELLHLSRYGRSFFNPEMVWYGYGSHMYKFYVQTSVSKNMVVVDRKMQEPAENRRLLFHSGPMMQAAAVDVTARWSNPPYGGMNYDEANDKNSLEVQGLKEGRSVPSVENPPPYGKFGPLTGYIGPIQQRRLTLVTDDYVVLADWLKANDEHEFESVFQMKGFQGLEAAGKKLVRHTAQWDPNPIGSAQFVTDCDWYDVNAPARASFQFQFGEGADNRGSNPQQNEPGTLNIDLLSLWPPEQEIMIGTVPETHDVPRQVTYAVRADGKALAEGQTGTWVLGQKSIDVPIKGAKTLELETSCSATKTGTLFWAGAVIVTANGKEIPVDQLPVVSDNTMQPKEKGKDFDGGPIKIGGVPYADAVSAQPQDGKKPAVVKIDLSGKNAVRFKAVLGGDFPPGDEAQRRKTVAIRAPGKSNEARFLTVMEPFEGNRMVKSATASGPDSLRVELADGRVQEIKIRNLDSATGNDIVADITETKDGKVVRTESTVAATQ